MTLLPFLALCLLTALVALVRGRHGSPRAIWIGGIGLAAASLAAVVASGEPSELGGTTVAIDSYLRFVLVMGCIAAILLTVLAATFDSRRRAAGRGPYPIGQIALAASLTLGATAIALAVPPTVAPIPAAIAGAAALLGLLGVGRDPANLVGGGHALRSTALAGALVIATAALVLGIGDPLAGEPFAIGAASLALVGAATIRIGAIPFHLSIARLVPRVGLVAPVVVIWPAIPLVIAAAAVMASGIAPLELPLGLERGLVAALAIVTLAVAPLVAVTRSDVEHLVAYAIVADAGLVVLAFAGTDSAWEGLRAWLLIFAITKTALVAWAVAMRELFGTSAIDDLDGWMFRAPLLGVALFLIAVGTVGLPGMAAFALRRDISLEAFGQPLATVALVIAVGSVLPYIRMGLVGLYAQGVVTRRAPGERLRRPPPRARDASRPLPGAVPTGRPAEFTQSPREVVTPRRTDPAAERAAARVGDVARGLAFGNGDRLGRRPSGDGRGLAEPRAGGVGGRPRGRGGSAFRRELSLMAADIRAAWALNLVPAAALVVLALSALALIAGAGWVDLRAMAAENLPGPIATQPPGF